jgi:hypothetical protein
MGSNKLVKEIIRNKKEVFYPLFTIVIGFLVYWIIYIFIDYKNSLIVLPFLLWSLTILIFKYTLDVNNSNIKTEKPTSKRLIFFLLFFSIVMFSVVILDLVILIIADIYYFIHISINIFIAILIYYVLQREVKKYYSINNEKIEMGSWN